MSAAFEATAVELRRRVAAREVSCEEVARTHLDRIAAVEPIVDAFLAVLADRALERARALDRTLAAGSPAPPLAGVPVAIKDVLHIEGLPTTCGSRVLVRLRAALHRHRGRAPGSRRRDRRRQDQHGRVRDGLVDRAQRLQADAQPLGPGAGPGRLVRRLGGRGGGRDGAGRARQRHGRLDPPARGLLRRRRPQADLRTRQPLRPRRLRLLARPGRAFRAHASPTWPSSRRPSSATIRSTRRAPRSPCRASRPPSRATSAGSVSECRAPSWRAASTLRRWRASTRPCARSPPPGPRCATSRFPICLTRSPPTTSWPRPRPRATSPATTASATACARPAPGDLRRHVRPHARRGLRPGGQAAHHPRDVRALRRLLRRLLRPRAEGAHPDPPRLRGARSSAAT